MGFIEDHREKEPGSTNEYTNIAERMGMKL